MTLPIGRPAALLVVAPHPDDEAIGAYTLMTRLRRRGVRVAVLIVSDGAASHPNSKRWPPTRLIRERQREARCVLRPIGVTRDSIRFLALPDGGLAGHDRAIRHAIARSLAALPHPVVALSPAMTDDHPDHRAVARAVRRQAGVRWRHYPVWPAGQRLRGGRPLHLSAQERLAKRHAIRRYRTQAGRITDDPTGFAMTRQQIAAFSRPQEWFAPA
ncbi:PIG-L family deacetylase [Sphingomonas sp.]|uniref:PIG-L deacetylase family protein n=1 Tax=Sphingomonas sp. TaxID=28214 RepID=UPI0028A1E5F1|nr:PIG-L family deacetylase [Sphingomonas sp.]